MSPATIIVLSVIAVAFVAIIINEIRKKKQGKSSCSCGCGGCAFRDSCHSDKK